MDLFAHGRQEQIERESPLANRLRPRTLEEFATFIPEDFTPIFEEKKTPLMKKEPLKV